MNDPISKLLVEIQNATSFVEAHEILGSFIDRNERELLQSLITANELSKKWKITPRKARQIIFSHKLSVYVGNEWVVPFQYLNYERDM